MLNKSICLLLTFLSFIRHIGLLCYQISAIASNPSRPVKLSNNSSSFLYHSTVHRGHHPAKMKTHLRGNNSMANRNRTILPRQQKSKGLFICFAKKEKNKKRKTQEISFLLCMPPLQERKVTQQASINIFLLSKKNPQNLVVNGN